MDWFWNLWEAAFGGFDNGITSPVEDMLGAAQGTILNDGNGDSPVLTP